MRNIGTLLLALLVSAAVAGAVQNQLAVALGAREEFIAVMMLFSLSVIVTTIALGVALAVSKTVSGVDLTALALLVAAALVLVGGLFATSAIAERKVSLSPDDLHIIAEIAVPTALMIGIQWWLVRRRWWRAHA